MVDNQSTSATLFDEVILKSMDWSELVEALLTSCHRLLSPVPVIHTPETEITSMMPTSEDVSQLAAFLDVNAISDILSWANNKLSGSPEHAEFYRTVRELALSADLAALKALLLQHQTYCSPAVTTPNTYKP
jgi:hypothetical protein